MLASPLYPSASFSPQQTSESSSQYRPARDLEAFNRLLPPPIEFVEGSSSGSLAVAEGKYEPINGTPRSTKSQDTPKPSPRLKPKINKAANLHTPTHATVPSLYTGVIDSSWPQGCTVGVGLHNTGNTCFLNSALQCLLHTPPLLRVLTAHSRSDPCRVKQGGFCMSCNLREVMFSSHGGKSRSSFTPYPISSKLQFIAKHMRRGRQEDSHEFLRYAVDALQKSCLAGQSSKIDAKLAETTWVHRIFGGRLRSRVTCRECNHNSDTFDSILDLSLDIYGASTVKEALRKFIAIDYLKGADKYKCEKCKKAVVAEKRFTIHQAPHILTIHLKRFSPLGRKIGHYVGYDERLSLQPVMSEGQFGPSYSLYGVICHAGGGPNSGHYYAHVKGASGRWFEMNDEMVSPLHNPPVSMKSAYMLFYIRDKGQALEAAVVSSAKQPPLLPPKSGLAVGMKKRKVIESEGEEEDTGVQTARPFIGPRLPSPSVTAEQEPKRQKPDPQAELVKKKIEAASQQAAGALQSLSQYNDDDSSSENEGTAKGEHARSIQDEPPAGSEATVSSSPAPPPTSPTSSLSPRPSPKLKPTSNPIPPSSFYASSNVVGKTSDRKRKSPDDEETAALAEYARKPLLQDSPRWSGHNPRFERSRQSSYSGKKSSFGGGAVSPYNRSLTSNNLHSGRRDLPIARKYGKKKRPLF